VARYASVNYTPPFPYADTDPDIFDSRDVQQLARAVEDHYHGPNYGRPVSHADLTGGAIGDPHPQYLTQAEGDSLYIDQAELDAALGNFLPLTGGTLSGPLTVQALTRTNGLQLDAAPIPAAATAYLLGTNANGQPVGLIDPLLITTAGMWVDTGTVLQPDPGVSQNIRVNGLTTTNTLVMSAAPTLGATPLHLAAVSAAGGTVSYYPWAALTAALDALFLTQADADLIYLPLSHEPGTDPHPQYATDADLAGHAAAADPHPGYITQAEGDALWIDQAELDAALAAAALWNDSGTALSPVTAGHGITTTGLATSGTLVLSAAPTLAAAPLHLMAVAAAGGSVSYYPWADLTTALDALFLTQADADLLYTDIGHETALDPHTQYMTQAETDAAIAAAALWADSGTDLSPVTAGHGITTTGLTTTATAVMTAAPTLAAVPLHFIAVSAAGGTLSHFPYADLVTAMDALFLTQAEGDALYMSINAQTLPPGGNAGDALVKNTATDFDAGWADVLTPAEGNALYATIASGLPPGGAVGDMLVKQTATDYDAIWQAPPAGAIEYWQVTAGELVPVGGEPVAAPQLRASASATLAAAPLHFIAVDAANAVFQQYAYADLVLAMDALFLTPAEATLLYAPITSGIPIGGAIGEVLTKQTATDYDAIWAPPAVSLPPGGNARDVLAKVTATDFDVAWTPADWTNDTVGLLLTAPATYGITVPALTTTGTLTMTAAPAGTVRPNFVLGLDALGGIVQTYDASLFNADGYTWGELEGAGQTWGDLEGTLPLDAARALSERIVQLEARLAAIGG
jgi:hypothetical protein